MKKIFQEFLLLSRGKQIALIVFLTHVALLFSLSCHYLIASRLTPPRPMVIKTITLAPPQIKTAPIKHKEKAEKTAPKPKAAPKPPPAKIVKEIAKSLDILASEPPKKALPLKIPEKIPQKKQIAEEDPTYGEFLIAYLQRALDLPEFGEVKIEIEIDASGKLLQCQVLESQNSRNALFLQSELALLSYPIPHLAKDELSKKFSVVFKNQ